MSIGDFDDFIATLSQETVEKIARDANESAAEFREDHESKGKAFFGNQIAMIAFAFSLGLLREYHEWLSKQLPD